MAEKIKILSWNVNGIRAMVNKGFYEIIKELDHDIVCIQETKAQDEDVKKIASLMNDYELLVNSAEKKGYSGTAIFSKIKPISHTLDMGIPEHDNEGRVITAEYDNFYLVNVYVPNSGSELKRLDYREEWDKDLLAFIKKLESEKPVIFTGDFNVAHQPIDLARPKPNYNKTAGYMQAEIDGMQNYLNAGLTDTYRNFYPDKVQYTFWNMRFRGREKGIGWRIDYFLVSNGLIKNIKDSYILDQIMGSDHCPIGLEMEM
ncbi:MAG: exodeoxyribonuclease III [Bacteroidales bacterium]|nr:exodeoxyribonuclease III [Bacteroidales bacterium]